MGPDWTVRAECVITLAGPAADRKLQAESRLHQTALHEAAHCVIGYFLSRPAVSVSIIPDEGLRTRGVTRFSEIDQVQDSPVLAKAANFGDEKKAASMFILANPEADNEYRQAWLEVFENEAETKVLHCREYIEALGKRLLHSLSLTGPQILETIEGVRLEKHRECMRRLGLAS